MTGTMKLTRLRGVTDVRQQLARDAREGLTASPKRLPSKYFYDARGSELFERITELEEYYPTRTETAILEAHADDLVARLRPHELVEVGAGVSTKTKLLLSALGHHGGERFAPIDVSEDALQWAGERLAEDFPWLRFEGVVGDFESHLLKIPREGRRLVCFLGSTIGNLEETERVEFLRTIRAMLQDEDRFLLGVDLVKAVPRLEAAYNDREGVTAAFNLNVLNVLNEELEADFPLDPFRHEAVWVREHERIEMRLVAERALSARVGRLDLQVDFAAEEWMRTEISCKFRRERVENELGRADLALERWVTDPAGDFGLALACPRPR